MNFLYWRLSVSGKTRQEFCVRRKHGMTHHKFFLRQHFITKNHVTLFTFRGSVCLGRHTNTVLSRNFFQLTSKMRCVDSLIVDRRRSCHTTFSFFRLKLKNFLSFFDFLLSLLWLFKLLLLFGVSAMSKSDPESVVSTSSIDASSTSSSVVLSS